jgi:UDP-xylose/UDP-N-acetylglucosamine transporter B4
VFGLGTTLSFLQMLFITVQSLPSVIRWHRPRWSVIPLPALKPRQIPLSVWQVILYVSRRALTWPWGRRTLQVVLVSAISVLNNLTYRYKLPLSIQIVLRSAGSCVPRD